MATSTVRRRGTDTSGRGIYASDYLWTLWQRILTDPRIAPFSSKLVVVQGAWMSKNGGGAAASAGYHDKGGCFDVRTRDLTDSQLDLFIRVAREYGWAFWRRDKTAKHGGMDPHAHGVCGTDHDLAAGAAGQWKAYLNGRNGLANNAPDYEWRPSPLVTKPPTPPKEKPARAGVLRARLYAATSKRFAERAARVLAKSKDRALVTARTELTGHAKRIGQTIDKMPTK